MLKADENPDLNADYVILHGAIPDLMSEIHHFAKIPFHSIQFLPLFSDSVVTLRQPESSVKAYIDRPDMSDNPLTILPTDYAHYNIEISYLTNVDVAAIEQWQSAELIELDVYFSRNIDQFLDRIREVAKVRLVTLKVGGNVIDLLAPVEETNVAVNAAP